MDATKVGYARSLSKLNEVVASDCVGPKQLMGRYRRLQKELSVAYSMVPWQMGWINRLANDLAMTEREIAALETIDEQQSETVLPLANHRQPRVSELLRNDRHFAAA